MVPEQRQRRMDGGAYAVARAAISRPARAVVIVGDVSARLCHCSGDDLDSVHMQGCDSQL